MGQLYLYCIPPYSGQGTHLETESLGAFSELAGSETSNFPLKGLFAAFVIASTKKVSGVPGTKMKYDLPELRNMDNSFLWSFD